MYTTKDAAERFERTPARIQQILISAAESGKPIGRKHGRDWILSESDLRKIGKKIPQPD